MKFSIASPTGIIIAGHRGNPAQFPENTMQSFRSAVSLGVDMIETDIHLTRDGVPVLMHDADTARTAGVPGMIFDRTLDELRALNVGTVSQPQQIPTLAEFLAEFAPVNGLLFDLELKIDHADTMSAQIARTVALVEQYDLHDRVLFNSFDAAALEYIYQSYGRRYRLHGYYPYNIMSNVSADPAEYLDYACYWASGAEAAERCAFLIDRGIAPCTGSNTSAEGYAEAAALGCAMFTENDPAAALAWRAQWAK